MHQTSARHANKLSSEVFIFQKATNMDTPQRREFQSKMSVKSSPFDDVPSSQYYKNPSASYNMPHVNK